LGKVAKPGVWTGTTVLHALASKVGMGGGDFGWPRQRIVNLGGIRAARDVEMYPPLWLTLYRRLGTGDFNVSLRVGG
jgi:hypothetical protein